MWSFDRIYQGVPAWLQTLLLNGHALRIHAHRYGRTYRAATQQLLEQERWSRQRLQSLKDQLLRRVIEVAYDKSTYYRRIMDQRGLRPADLRRIDDLPKLPILEKEEVRKYGREMLTARRPRRGWWPGHTSGTTGTPLGLWYDRFTSIMTNAVDRRQKLWAGMDWNDWIGLFLGRMVVAPSQNLPPFWRTNFVQREVWFSSFHLSDEYLPHYIDEIRRRGLHFLEGYPSTLYIVATFLLRRGETLPMTAVISSSETLHQVQREAIEEAFCCPLFDFYAMAERTIYAGECELHAGKHIAEEYGHVEVVDEKGDPVPGGSTGYLVGTSLHNTAMPMLRYRLNDVSHLIPDPCDCGRELMRMGDVTTKAEDIIRTPDGRWISPSIMTHPFKSLEYVAESQIIQETLDRLIVKVVPTHGEELFRHVDEPPLRASLSSRLGPDIMIEIAVVREIEREKSGKFRWVISEVDKSEQIPWKMEA